MYTFNRTYFPSFPYYLFYRSNTNNSEGSKLELPFITAKSMPPLPHLYNPDSGLDHVVKFHIFRYTFSRAALKKWADNHQIDPEERGATLPGKPSPRNFLLIAVE